MKKLINITAAALLAILSWSCGGNSSESASSTSATVTENLPSAGQSAVRDEESARDVVKVAAGSKDHTTLVAAIKQAGLVDALSNAGPFTVFAPVNSAFEKLPRGTVDDLMKPENKEKLVDILQYHVYVGGLSTELMQDSMRLNQVNGGNVIIRKKDGKVMVNNATILASISAANGIIHVIDEVLMPAAQK